MSKRKTARKPKAQTKAKPETEPARAGICCSSTVCPFPVVDMPPLPRRPAELASPPHGPALKGPPVAPKYARPVPNDFPEPLREDLLETLAFSTNAYTRAVQEGDKKGRERALIIEKIAYEEWQRDRDPHILAQWIKCRLSYYHLVEVNAESQGHGEAEASKTVKARKDYTLALAHAREIRRFYGLKTDIPSGSVTGPINDLDGIRHWCHAVNDDCQAKLIEMGGGAAPPAPVTKAPAPVGTTAQGEKADGKAREGGGAGGPSLNHWTRDDLNEAIQQYKALRAARYAELVEAVETRNPGATKAAREMFGRNAIVRKLGVRCPSMVSNSPAWMMIAQALEFPLARNRVGGTRHTTKDQGAGHQIAVERRSRKPAPGADNEPPDVKASRAERETTLREIRRLAESGRTAPAKKRAKASAKALLGKYEADEMTDKQVRQTVKTLLTRA